MTEEALKKVVKEAISAALREQRQLILDSILEALEDYGLLKAMCEAESSKPTSRKAIMKILKGKP